MKKINLVVAFLFIFSIGVFAQLDYQNVITVILNDGTHVICYGKAGDERMEKSVGFDLASMRTSVPNFDNVKDGYKGWRSLKDGTMINPKIKDINYLDDYYFTGEYYYLPVKLRLSEKIDGTPEFLFMKYTTEQRVDAGGAQGAIMHFLMEWGLNKEQEKEATEKLRAKVATLKASSSNSKFKKVEPVNVTIAGPVKIISSNEESFRIISAILGDKSTAPSVVSSGRSPALPGQKVAVAAKLDKIGAQLLAATFEKNRSISDVSLELRFKYKVLTPGIKGQIKIQWQKIDEMFHDRWAIENSFDREEMITQMLNAKAVEISLTDFGGGDKDDSQKKAILEAFMSTFSSSMEVENSKDDSDREEDKDSKELGKKDGVKERVDIIKFKSRMKSGIEVINLNYRMTITEEAVLCENLGAWYDGVRNNKKCVSSVNLNDPFFSHRDIHFILDNKVKDVFENEVNYVTVNVRKKRTSGNPFQEQITIDSKYLKENGARASLTYARGEDKNPDMYEYKSQWSLRGGKLFPENPEWIKGDWQGVQLSCPMVPRTIQFESDLEELKQMGIVRATLQLRYMKYGVERESNIPMTVSQGKALVEEKLFIDEDTPGYAYRLVLTHKEKGKVALDWDTKLNDDYVYAIIPKKLKEGDDVIWKKVLDAAKVIAEPDGEGIVKLQDRILDKFMKVLKVVTGQK
jgi:hypothetical protein